MDRGGGVSVALRSISSSPPFSGAEEFWVDVVQSYGRCSITKANDKLIAIAGVAQSLTPLFQDDCVAGLWKKDLPWNLVWYMCNIDGEIQLPQENRCKILIRSTGIH